MHLRGLNTAEWFAMWRVISFPLILLFIYLGERSLTAWFYMLFFSTDILDGFFAKFFDMESERRAQLDTLGDILYLLTGLVGYYAFETEHFRENALLLLFTGGAYLLQLIFSMSKWGKPSNYHTWLAKLAAFAQVSFLVFTFFFMPYWLLFYIATFLSLLDALEDIVITFILNKRKSNLRGLPWLLVGKKKEDIG